ncbi:hypothetical protein O6H91_14G050200 [Diphasiastrum complanatum]|nr:hypothetical protein O6H91_14G050200 [Diphasiastrum complanatum]
MRQGHAHRALSIFEKMEKEGFIPNSITFVSVLRSCGVLLAIDKGKKLHAQVRKNGLESNIFVGSILVDMYARCGDLSEARRVFNRLQRKNVVAWNAMIAGYANHGLGHHALELFKDLQTNGIKPNGVTFGSILKACGSIAAIDQGKWIHSQVIEHGLESDMLVGSALVDMYAKCGDVDKAHQVFDSLPGRDIVSWSALIGGYAQHGLGQEALQVFESMQQEGLKPNDITLVSVLCACSHANLFDDGFRIFQSMFEDVGIAPKMEHYTCIIDLLGRAGNLEEAEDLILKMPVEADAAVWMSMLRACRTQNNVEVGRRSFESLLKLEPSNAAAHVLMSNIYAALGMWKEKADIRNKMLSAGWIMVHPGVTWIEFNNQIHTFVVQDKVHPQKKEIYEMGSALKETIKVTQGYEPDLSCVLDDMPDTEKEEQLWAHSEKLALSFGLINIPAGVPIRLVKNSRICSDCHTATKMIAKVTGREIIERDAKRFHHFKDGVCSCGDYW